MKYKVGDRVRIKSFDWYNKNKDADSCVHCGDRVFDNYMSVFCGSVVTIGGVSPYGYDIREDMHCRVWTDEMIEGLAEDETKSEDRLLDEYEELTDRAFKGGYEKCKSDIELNGFQLPEGYIFKDENGNVINATKIVLDKKKKEYPKTYEECRQILGYRENSIINVATINDSKLFGALYRLKVCRDAYWKIAGEEMGLGKPWIPVYQDDKQDKHCIYVDIWGVTLHQDNIVQHVLSFPTKEMRDAFKENFDPDIEICKELL